ncbi:DUF1289 domain-containing protein [Aureimonas flava]|uniref:DUF1289 domain-containing protein n=1 Tax=Aureimonas flava TaxID=2320271 RepID=A0A3A1WKJ3_9HYPH|nr:DUF1289 domain-containing protein [Aureimonas flava]RIY01829.1 DUF1289 domain-containing protein [Aureimonas flava]
MSAAPAPLASPCVRVCALDAAGALCVGCGRTIQEIAAWSGMSEASRLAIMGELAERLRLHALEAV